MKLGVYGAISMISDLQIDLVPLVVGMKNWTIHRNHRENE